MTHLLRIVGMTLLTLLLIGAALATAINGGALSGPSVPLGATGVGGHRLQAGSDPCVPTAPLAEAPGRPAIC